MKSMKYTYKLHTQSNNHFSKSMNIALSRLFSDTYKDLVSSFYLTFITQTFSAVVNTKYLHHWC